MVKRNDGVNTVNDLIDGWMYMTSLNEKTQWMIVSWMGEHKINGFIWRGKEMDDCLEDERTQMASFD